MGLFAQVVWAWLYAEVVWVGLYAVVVWVGLRSHDPPSPGLAASGVLHVAC